MIFPNIPCRNYLEIKKSDLIRKERQFADKKNFIQIEKHQITTKIQNQSKVNSYVQKEVKPQTIN